MKRAALLAVVSLVPLIAGCGGGGASEPPVTSVNPIATSVLQFTVGTATISFNHGTASAHGLNVVATLRQADGLSGVLYSIPTITGPSSFAVSTSIETGTTVLGAGADTGTNHITWATLNNTLWAGQPRGLKAATTGVFGYGLCPCNQDAGANNGTPTLFTAFNLPVYGNDEMLYYGGPPAFPRGDPDIQNLGFEGYSLGFTDFAVAPAVGSYRLAVAIPPGFNQPGNPTPSPQPGNSPTPGPGMLYATAVLPSLHALPPYPLPSFAPDGNGGGAIALHTPAGVEESVAIVRAIGYGPSGNGACQLSHVYDQFYTIVSHGAGVHTLTLAPNLGRSTSGTVTPSICPHEQYFVYAAGFNYPAYESSYPQNLSQAPRIAGKGGTADVTTTDALEALYP